ncbi:hypothetical protein V6N13_065272 [Hibiscus sabdariffa]
MQVVNKRHRNVNIQGPSGTNGGSNKAGEVIGLRFVTLSSKSPDVVEGGIESQVIGEEHGVRAISREPQLASTVCDSGVSISRGVHSRSEQRDERRTVKEERQAGDDWRLTTAACWADGD